MIVYLLNLFFLLLNKPRCLFFLKTHLLSGAIWMGHSSYKWDMLVERQLPWKIAMLFFISVSSCVYDALEMTGPAERPFLSAPQLARVGQRALGRVWCHRKAGDGHGITPSWEANISASVPALHPSHFVSFGPVRELLKLWFTGETQWLCLSTYPTDRGLNTGNLVVSVKNRAPALMKLMSDRTERN